MFHQLNWRHLGTKFRITNHHISAEEICGFAISLEHPCTSRPLEIKEGFKHSWRLIFPSAKILSRSEISHFLSLFFPFFLANFLERNREEQAICALIVRISRGKVSRLRSSVALLLKYSAEVTGFALLSSLAFSHPRLMISFEVPGRARDRLQRTQNYFLDKLA